MLSLSASLEQFDSHGLRAQNDKLIDIPDMVTVLTDIYERIAAENPSQISVPLCVDLAINWLLNVYDRYKYVTYPQKISIDPVFFFSYFVTSILVNELVRYAFCPSRLDWFYFAKGIWRKSTDVS